MKVLPISFTGLKGATKTSYSSNEYAKYTHTDVNYYPFEEESVEEIDEFVRQNSRYRLTDSSRRGGKSSVDSKSVKVLGCLPFTEDEYKKYKTNPEELAMSKRIIIASVLAEIEREKRLEKIKL